MNGLADFNQTSKTDWGPPPSGRVYHRSQPISHWSKPHIQLAELAELEAQMTQFENVYEELIAEIQRQYVMPADPRFLNFFRSHRRIPQLLMEALPYLRKFFANSIFVLHATSDENGWQMLYASATWPGEPSDALTALDHFDDEWWIANSYPAGMALTFTYKLV